jgi:hypothetical protein
MLDNLEQFSVGDIFKAGKLRIGLDGFDDYEYSAEAVGIIQDYMDRMKRQYDFEETRDSPIVRNQIYMGAKALFDRLVAKGKIVSRRRLM